MPVEARTVERRFDKSIAETPAEGHSAQDIPIAAKVGRIGRTSREAMLGLRPMKRPPDEIDQRRPGREGNQAVVNRQEREISIEPLQTSHVQGHQNGKKDGVAADEHQQAGHHIVESFERRASDEEIAGQTAPQRRGRKTRDRTDCRERRRQSGLAPQGRASARIHGPIDGVDANGPAASGPSP